MRTYLICYDIAAPSAARPGKRRHGAGRGLGAPPGRHLVCAVGRAGRGIERRLRPFADAADGLLIQEVDARALLLNTALRWFRRRQPAGAETAAPVAMAA